MTPQHSRQAASTRKEDRVTEPVPFVIDAGDAFPAAELFTEARDQVVVAVRITPVYGQVDLGLLAVVVDEANSRGFALARLASYPQ